MAGSGAALPRMRIGIGGLKTIATEMDVEIAGDSVGERVGVGDGNEDGDRGISLLPFEPTTLKMLGEKWFLKK
jgi:hypothetical protein